MNDKLVRARKVAGKPPTVAIIGCGAIARSLHLPALARYWGVLERVVLVDPDKQTLHQLAGQYGITRVATDYRDVMREVDGAVVAAPHNLHHSITLTCVRNGVHVLCEKPLANSRAEVQDIIDEAARVGVSVSVNNIRRLFPSFNKVGQLIREGAIGEPRYLEFYEGEEFDWPSASGSFFGTRSGGKGVLLDKGAHVVDLVCWWLGGKPTLIAYEDDTLGGSEAVAKLSFLYGSCRGDVHLSWLSRLRNSFRIRGEAGSIEGTIFDWRSITLMSETGGRVKIRTNSEFRTFSDLGKAVVSNFLDVITKGAQPSVSPEDVADSIALIEECYAKRSRCQMPWHDTLYRLAYEG